MSLKCWRNTKKRVCEGCGYLIIRRYCIKSFSLYIVMHMLNILYSVGVYSHIPHSISKFQFQSEKNACFLDPLAVAKGHAFNQIGGGGDRTRYWWGEWDYSQPTYRYAVLWRGRHVDKIKIYFRHKRYIDQ